MRGAAAGRAARVRLAALALCRRGGVALNFALAAPALLVAAGMAVDYAQMTDLRRKMQEAADAAALAAARELRLANTDAQRAAELARRYVDAHLAARGLVGYSVSASVVVAAPATQPSAGGGGGAGGSGGGGAGGGGFVDLSTTTSSLAASADGSPGGAAAAPAAPAPVASGAYNGVAVHVAFPVQGAFSQLLNRGQTTLNARAEARLTGGMPLCMIALEGTGGGVLQLTSKSTIEAPGCAIYSDSADPSGLSVTGMAALRSGFTCSSGGKEGASVNYSPLPQLDCPAMPDPLAARPAPPAGGCAYTNMHVRDGVRTLMPGVYCGGLRIDGSANVTLSPGDYVIRDGGLLIAGQSTVKGANVGFYLQGELSLLKLAGNANVELTAPKTGPLAGMLFFEDRAASAGRVHEVASDYVRILLGTIYLPRGYFKVTSANKVGDMSAYTVVVARRVLLAGSPALYLNIAYGATDVPVPEGLGPNGGATRLVR